MPKAMKDADRSFSVEESTFGHDGGRYVSPVPATAAKHAGHILFAHAEKGKKSVGHVFIKLREITREVGAKNKVFFYKVSKVKKPASEVKVKVFKKKDGSKVEVKALHDYVVLSVDEADFKKASKH